MAFNNYLEDENDKPYFTTNSLAYYYDKMEGFAKAVEGSAKALNLTKEEIEQRIALRLAEWDKNLESFDGSVEKLLTEWVDDGTLTHVIDSTLIDRKIAPVTLQLAETEAEAKRKRELEDLSPTVLAALENKDWETPFNLLSIPQYKSVTPEKATFFKIGKNLFNKHTVKNDVSIKSSTGGEIAGSSFAASDFIRVSPSTQYTKIGAFEYATYDANKVYISGGASATFTTPPNAAYIRISTTKSTLDSQQVEMGGVSTAYEPYREYIEAKHVEKQPVLATDIPPLSIESLAFSKQGSNLFQKEKTSENFYIRSSNGDMTAGSGFFASDFVAVLPSSTYTIKALRHIAYYDSNKVFISGTEFGTSFNYQAETPSNAAFIRFSWYKSDGVTVDDQQVNKGVELLPYEENGRKIPKEYLELTSSEPEERITLPPKIYGVVGKEINIYFQNPLNVPLREVYIDVTCTVGKQEENRWTFTPTAAGTFPITIAVYKKYQLAHQQSATLIIKAETVGAGNRNALIIGDSTINNEYMLQAFVDKYTGDPMGISFYGTRGVNVKHEGRGGWRGSDYRSDKTYLTVVNPFYNPATTDFDFGYYMTNQAYPKLDYVGICLGINDVFAYTSDSSVATFAPEFIANINHMANSVKAHDATIKVGVFVTIPPNESQNAFAESYANGQTQWRYKRNNAIWIEELVKFFKGKEAQGIYLIPDNVNIDAKTGYGDGVHPNAEIGDRQRADTLYYFFKSFEV